MLFKIRWCLAPLVWFSKVEINNNNFSKFIITIFEFLWNAKMEIKSFRMSAPIRLRNHMIGMRELIGWANGKRETTQKKGPFHIVAY